MAQEFDLGYVRGETGPQGIQGPEGPQGATGATPNITVGNTVTLEPGEPASVVIREGSLPEAPVLDFGIPGGASSGDMSASVYDPNNKHQDIFAYADVHGGKRTYTVTVAAADSKNINNADFVCTGTNDHHIINQAINSLPDNGGTVFLMEGTYHISLDGTAQDDTTLLWPIIDLSEKPNVILRGCGASSIIKLADNSITSTDQSYHLVMTSAYGAQVHDLCVDGNRDNGNTGTTCGVHFSAYASTSLMSGCEIKNCYTGVNVVGQYNMISRCVFSYCNMGLEGKGPQLKICDNVFHHMDTYGIKCRNACLHACGNRIDNCGTAGLYSTTGYRGIITNNIFNGNPIGVHLYFEDYVMVTGNSIRRSSSDTYANGEYSILIDSCRYCMALLNYVYGKDVSITNDTGSRNYLDATNWNFHGQAVV